MILPTFIRTLPLIAVLLGTGTMGFAKLPAGCLPPPADRVLVLDLAQLLTSQQEAELNRSLLAFTDTTSNVIVVVTHPDFCGLEPYEFATEAGHEWGVGRADLDNGVVIALKPRIGNEKGQIFIAVGQGLEGAIPDLVTRRIVDDMIPSFGQGRWMDGLQVGVGALMLLAAGEIAFDDYLTGERTASGGDLLILLVFALFMFGLPAFAVLTSARRSARMNNTTLWAAVLLALASSRSHSGSYRHFRGGSGPFGGGGGFGGFGGGSFGGGGAGGSF